ncbi:MAG: MerR family DNA-binding transcriptional regulator, partial [Patescibacteria group bacterium]
MSAQNKLLSISQASKYLGVSNDTLRRWEKRGKITPLRTLGNVRRYRIEDLQQLKTRKGTPTTKELIQKTHQEIAQIKQTISENQKDKSPTPTPTPTSTPIQTSPKVAAAQSPRANQDIAEDLSVIKRFLYGIASQLNDVKRSLLQQQGSLSLSPSNSDLLNNTQKRRQRLIQYSTIGGSTLVILLFLLLILSKLFPLNNKINNIEKLVRTLDINYQSPPDSDVSIEPENIESFRVGEDKIVFDEAGNIYFSGGLTGGYIDTDTRNLIINSGFEQNSSGRPDYYTYADETNEQNTFISQDISFEGKNTLKLEPKSGQILTVKPHHLPLDPHKHYTFTAYVRALGLRKTYVSIGYGDREGEDKEVIQLEGSSSWKQIRFTKTFSESDTPKSDAFYISALSQDGGGALYIDGLQLETGTLASAYKPQALRSDGVAVFDEDALVPVITNTGSLGTGTQPFKEAFITTQNVFGDLQVGQDASISGNLTVTGIVDLNAITVRNKILSQNDGIYTGTGAGVKRLDHLGNLLNINNLTFSGGLYSFNSNGNIVANNITTTGNIILPEEGTIGVTDNEDLLTLSESIVTLDGYLTVDGSATINDAATVNGKLSANNGLAVSGDNLTVGNSFSVDVQNGNVTSGSITASANITTAGNLAVNGGIITSSGSLTINPDSNLTLDADNVYLPGSSIWSSDGNVGIGTTNPNYKLVINGDAFIPSGYDFYLGSRSEALFANMLGTREYASNRYVVDYESFTNSINTLDEELYNLASGGIGIWSLTTTTLHPSDTNYNLAVGGTDSTASFFFDTSSGRLSLRTPGSNAGLALGND